MEGECGVYIGIGVRIKSAGSVLNIDKIFWPKAAEKKEIDFRV